MRTITVTNISASFLVEEKSSDVCEGRKMRRSASNICYFQINYKVYKTKLVEMKGHKGTNTYTYISNLLICLIWKEEEGDNFDL